MKKWKKYLCGALLPLLIMALTGCVMTIDEMYAPPRRSEAYDNLQTVMDEVMGGVNYSAPVSGENQQTVQMEDLTGDKVEEVILFAKGADEKPLKIIIFEKVDDEYQMLTTIESAGTSFDQVEYVQMDGKPGLELVVGRQVSNRILRNVSVYSFSSGQANQLLNANYRKFLTCDLNEDELGDLLILTSGQDEAENGIAELYTMKNGKVERSSECFLSEPVSNLKRIMEGDLSGGKNAVFVASSVDENAIITDVFAMINGVLTNVSFSNESGTSVSTLRNYYVFADDIDQDGEMELPHLITMKTPTRQVTDAGEHLIRWYSMAPDGLEVDKLFTYHNYLEGWYVVLDPEVALRICVTPETQGGYSFRIWSEDGQTLDKLFTIYVLTGDSRTAQAAEEDRFTLLRTDTVVYAGSIEPAGGELGIDRDDLIAAFHLIQFDWYTGEM